MRHSSGSSADRETPPSAMIEARKRIEQLEQQIAGLTYERDRLLTFLEVYDSIRPSMRPISGREIDVQCQRVLAQGRTPLTTKDLIRQLERLGLSIQSNNPAGLVSSRLSMHPQVGSTDDGWVLRTLLDAKEVVYEG